jgi:hypothetical protein
MMEERHRDDGFEVTFVVSTPRAAAWKLLAGATPASDALPPPGPGQWWVPAVEGAADELDVVPEHVLRVRKATPPCDGTEIVVTMEDADTGTRITFVQSGFGPDFDRRRPWLEAGWWAIRADLFVFFERGVAGRRHLRPWSSVGAEVEESPGGLVVVDVEPGRFADQAGFRPGDLILTIAGSPVLTVRDLAVLGRALASGTETKARYLRGSRAHSGTGVL